MTLVIVFHPYCPHSIGEQIVQVPFLRLLRAMHPDETLVGVAPGPSGHVLEALRLLDEHHVYPIENGAGRLARIVRDLRRRKCRAAFQLRRKSVRTAIASRLATFSPIVGFRGAGSFLFQSRTVEFDRERYIAESYLALIGRRLDDLPQPVGEADDYVLFVPGGLTEVKRYPMESYLAIARALPRPARFLLGPDRESERDLLLREPGVTVDLAPDFKDMERIIRRATLVIANDCGPAHFAHIHDVPRISLFDRSIDDRHWFRAGRTGRLLRSPRPGAIAEIPPDEVVRTAEDLLSEGA